MFIEAQSPFGDCGGNITDAENGIIKSPNFPEKYSSSGKGNCDFYDFQSKSL